MKVAAGLTAVLVAALAQVAVAPLFPVGGAVANGALIVLAGVALVLGPLAAMVALPLLCVFQGFASDRSPGLLLIAYLPLLPVATLVEEARLPGNRFIRMLTAVAVVGAWARLVLAGAAFIQGAAFTPGALVRELVIPGLFLDIGLFALAYLPPRAVGWTPQRLTLRRAGRY